MLRVDVHAEEHVSAQARRYAEYRVFAALTQLSRPGRVRRASVTLGRAPRAGECDGIECSIVVDVGDTTFTVRACADHPYAAINRAVDRLTPRSAGAPLQQPAM